MPRPATRPRTGIVDVVVVGAGHSGLAMSHRLSALSIGHVVLERGEVATLRNERWDSLRLLTRTDDPLAGCWIRRARSGRLHEQRAGRDFIAAYAKRNKAPVQTGTTVLGVEPHTRGYAVSTDRGDWQARAVVLASGACNEASVPACAQEVPDTVFQITSKNYKSPAQLPAGGALVVGASATGLQLAQEIHASGRPVMLAVGEHVRMPRRYRGRDVQWWMLASGLLDQCIDDVDDPVRVRRLPSPQLIGSPDHATLDLNALTAMGVRLAGRLAGIRNGKAQFSGSLRNVCSLADLKMRRMLNTFDDWAATSGVLDHSVPAEDPEPTRIGDAVPLGLDLVSGEILSIVWATGYRPDYSG
jgi:putative flavoprotein involved in K+ transport